MSQKLNLNCVREYRKALGESQTTFWGRFGVTQSGGCRYETERNMTIQVAALIWLVDTKKLNEVDLAKAFAAVKKQLSKSP